MPSFFELIQQVLGYYEGDVTISMLGYLIFLLIGLVLPAVET